MALRTALPHAASSIHWAALVASTKRFYEREGVEVETVGCSYEEMTAGVLSGDIPIIRRGPDIDITLMEAGRPVRIIAGLVLKSVLKLFTRPGITSIQQLKGKTFGTIDPRLGSTSSLRLLLVDAGLTENDYQLVLYGGTPQRLEALRTGKIDGAMLAPPWTYRAEDEGFVPLARIADHSPDYLSSSIQANVEFAQRHPEDVARFLRATVRAQRWLYDPANKDESLQMLAAAARMSAAEARASYEEMVERDRVFAAAGEIGPENLRTVLSGLRQLGDLPEPRMRPEEYMDLTYLNRALQGD